MAVFGALAAFSSSFGFPNSAFVLISFNDIPPGKKIQGAKGGLLQKFPFIYDYTPLSASSGLVVISPYRRVFRGKQFSNGTMFRAQRIRPHPVATMVI